MEALAQDEDDLLRLYLAAYGAAEAERLLDELVMGRAAPVIELSPDEFAELWHDLPLDDNTIAGRLGLARQQVINLRKSARGSRAA